MYIPLVFVIDRLTVNGTELGNRRANAGEGRLAPEMRTRSSALCPDAVPGAPNPCIVRVC